ncbi:MAG: hypothetical protein KDC33_08360 [Thermoleophilia bacterium]|nr:hypothetical protein [Thermoleophilia bacterium]
MEIVAGILGLTTALLLAVVLRQRAAARRDLTADADEAGAPAEVDRAFQVMPLAALRVDADTHVVEANARARERFPHVAPGQRLLEAFGEHRLAEAVAGSLREGVPRTIELRLFSTDRRTYRVQVEPLGGAGAAEALVHLTDLTEAVAYAELRFQFVANVSHELRTPLTGLGGMLEALEDPDIDPATHDRFVRRAGAEIQRLDALISDILFLSDLQSHPGNPSGEQADLAAVARQTRDELADKAAAQEITLAVEACPPTWVPLTPTMAGTVVRNLMENAVRYSGPQSTVVARLTASEPPPERTGDWVALEVMDNGVGIPERHLPHVFERFYRADPSRSKQMGGTGLGLSIVKHIAERFGGEATASSREGFGTTVRVVLPRVEAPAPD